MYTYATLVSALQSITSDNDTEFVAELPAIIRRAEERMLRDLNLELFETIIDTLSTTADSREVILPPEVVMTSSLWFRAPASTRHNLVEERSYAYCKDYAPDEVLDTGSPRYYCELVGSFPKLPLEPVQVLDAMESDSSIEFGELVTVLVVFSSTPYPVEAIDGMESAGELLEWLQDVNYAEAMENNLALVAGELRDPLIFHDNGFDAMESGWALVDGELRDPLITYDNGFDAMESDGVLISGSLRAALIDYSNWPAEAMESAGAIISGDLT